MQHGTIPTCHLHYDNYTVCATCSVESEGCVEREAVCGRAEELCDRWSRELESGGNVRFIPGTPPSAWYLSCTDIVQSRLTVTQVSY